MLGPANAGIWPMCGLLFYNKWRRSHSVCTSYSRFRSSLLSRDSQRERLAKPVSGLVASRLEPERKCRQQQNRQNFIQTARFEEMCVASDGRLSDRTTGDYVLRDHNSMVVSQGKVELLKASGNPTGLWQRLSSDKLSILKACSSKADLGHGKIIHDYIVRNALEIDKDVGNALIAMYANCGSLPDARKVFDSLVAKDEVSWNTMVAAYANLGSLQEAIGLFQLMHHKGIQTRRVTLIRMLKACSNVEGLAQGRLMHSYIVRMGAGVDLFVASTLINMYSSCGSLRDARSVFDALLVRDVVTWNAMITGYAQHGHGQEAIHLFQNMESESMYSDHVTLLSLLKACSSVAALEQGKLLHTKIVSRGLDSNVFIANTLIDMYAKCGTLEDACRVFDGMFIKDQVTWSAMIAGYVQHGYVKDALQLFQKMQGKGMHPSKVTVMSILKACSSRAALDQGKIIHELITARGFESDALVSNTLIDMYAKCGSLTDAREVFDRLAARDLVSWNVMISGYAECGDWHETILLFQGMQQEGIQPDKYTLVSILKACSNLAALDWGKLIHAKVICTGVESEFVASTLIDMYGSCGCMEEAYKVFAKLSSRHLVTWTAMIAGYAQQGDGQQALELFWDMLREGLLPDKVTLVSILKACSSVAALHVGKMIHTQILEYGFESDITVTNTVIDMYAKCGSLEDAQEVFDGSNKRDVVSWNALIKGHAQHGGGQEALRIFYHMLQEAVHPDSITFRSLLSACSHSGLLEEGIRLFRAMSDSYSVSPEMKHYVCMVDLLCRCGCLKEAEDLIKEMPGHPDVVVWMSLLAACRTHGDVGLGKRAFEAIVRLNATNASCYVLMGDIYGAAGRLEDRAEVRREMHSVGAKKEPGRTWMEFGNEVHNFVVDDEKHPERRAVYGQLKTLTKAIPGKHLEDQV